ncbi:MAG TPA: ABC transporter substrate-binding protein [Ilumatobacteraceae bacterium]|nr:ABC transporter substrate-binding protein [Ilumatobacteraceae bacterium]
MTNQTRRIPRRRSTAIAALTMISLITAACSGDKKTESSPTTTAATSSSAATSSAPTDSTTPGSASQSSTSGSASDTTTASTTSGTVEVKEGVALTDEDAGKIASHLLGEYKPIDGNTVRGINGKVIRIGGVSTAKDERGVENYPGVCDGAKARFERANKEGGVNGYTFEYVGCQNDGQNPDTSAQQVKDMVEQEKVFALIPYTSVVSNQGDYLNEQRVPYFGWGLSPDYCGWNERQFAFAITGAISCMPEGLKNRSFFSSVGLETYVKGSKKAPKDIKAAFLGSSEYISAVSIDAFSQIGKSIGMDVVYAKTPLPGAGQPPLTDYSPVAQEIVASGANFVAVPGNPVPVIGLVPALKAAGYTGDVVMYFADARLLAVATQLDGVYAQGPNFGSVSFPSDTFKKIRADLDAIGSSAPEDGAGTLTSYGSAEMFINALKGVKGDLTAESLASVINSGFSNPQLGNAICGTEWPASHVVAGSCAALVRFQAEPKALTPIADLGPVGRVYLLPVKAS